MRSRTAPDPDRQTGQPLIRRLFFPVLGLLSLLWFLVRVIPKPSRATYPCQQAAFPVASAFLVWVTGVTVSTALGLKARTQWRRSRPAVAALFVGLAVLVALPTLVLQSSTGQAALAGLRNALLPVVPPLAPRWASSDTLTVMPEAVVGAVKSTQAQAADIDFAEITTMVNEAIGRAGGFADLIADGDTVILKPNLIAACDCTAAGEPLSPTVNGIATDYRVIQAVVNSVRDVNPNGAVFLLEGSGVGMTAANMAVVQWDLVTGLDSTIYLEDTGEAWFDTTSAELMGVSLPEGKALYGPAENRYWLSKLYYEADVLISLPVLKNHFVSGVTGAVKNVGIGSTPPKIYGLGPPYPSPNERSRINHGYSFSPRNALHNWIHDFYMCRPVDFVIMDGLQGIENGPLCHEFINGTQNITEDQKNARLILAGRDPIALDAIESLLCGHDPLQVGHLVKLHNDTLGCCDPRLIRVNGVMVGDESQDYEIDDSGSYSKHSDFTPPWVVVRGCEAVGGDLHLYLDVDPEMTKLEATVNGTWLNEIRIGQFEHSVFDLDTLTVDVGDEVIVYAYDAYLNYTSAVTTVATSVGAVSEEAAAGLRVWPTPCRASASIQYALRRQGSVQLSVFAVDGRRVKNFVDGEQPAGVHRVDWDAGLEALGVYFVKLQTDEGVATRKLVKVE